MKKLMYSLVVVVVLTFSSCYYFFSADEVTLDGYDEPDGEEGTAEVEEVDIEYESYDSTESPNYHDHDRHNH